MSLLWSALLALLIIAGTATFTAFNMLTNVYKQAALEVCDLIENHYYKANEPEAVEFVASCRTQAENQSFILSKASNVKRINQRLSALETSHLSLYSPSENKIIWENQGWETGIRARIVEEHMIVYHVIASSPAEKVGIAKGDILISLNGQMISSANDAKYSGGLFKINRNQKEIEIHVDLAHVDEDLGASLEDLGGGVGLLKIPSFLPRYFESGKWRKLTSNLDRFPKIIIDLRENAGGSFPAMMRALSPFRCGDPDVGAIHRPFKSGMEFQGTLLDDLKAESQLNQLSRHSVLKLRAFEGYGCYKGRLILLIDSGTSSVAEIFAEALKKETLNKKAMSLVWGHPSAGEVVLAQWFPVTALGGEDYSVSIPIAGYRTQTGQELEFHGVMPQRILTYEVADAIESRDTWIEEAKKALLVSK